MVHTQTDMQLCCQKITENGVSFANKYITPLTNADISSFSSFTDEERELLLSLMQRQLDYLKKGTEGLWK